MPITLLFAFYYMHMLSIWILGSIIYEAVKYWDIGIYYIGSGPILGYWDLLYLKPRNIGIFGFFIYKAARY